MRIAQTNIQLYNQLRAQGRPRRDLILVHRSYELLTTLYPGYYQADGKPFVAHGVGVGSILAELDQPAELVAVGLLHNVYGNADFGDGGGPGATRSRRRVVREAVGERIEALIVRFAELRIRPHTIQTLRRDLPHLDETERGLVLVDLADHLEKYVDLGVLYFGENGWVRAGTERIAEDLTEIAGELGEPDLAEMLSAALAEAAVAAKQVPPELKTPDRRPYLKLIVPRSCRRRLAPGLRGALRRLRP